LLRQRSAGPGAPAMCVHGGTTATMVAVLDGSLMVVANCGDSSAVMCGVSREAFPMQSIESWPAARAEAGCSGLEAQGPHAVLPDLGVTAMGGSAAKGASAVESKDFDSGRVPPDVETVTAADSKSLSVGWEMSADHGPENPGEYERMRASHPSRADRSGHTPQLSFVYDTLTSSKTNCPDIFARDPVSSRVHVTNHG